MKHAQGPMRSVVFGLLALCCVARAAAHDFWIEPATHTPAAGQPVAVRLLVGEHGVGDPVARPSAGALHRFVVANVARGTRTTLPGRVGADPAGAFRAPLDPAQAGAHVIGYHGKPVALELPADTFNAYLREEGLESILAQRAERGQLGQPGRELYSRCAKSLLLVGPAEAGAADVALGFPLELVAEQAPWSVREGESLSVRLLYQGRPLAGALVVAMPLAAPHDKVAQRSGTDGRVVLPLARSGAWLVKAVHMVPAPPDSGADWESLWASLSLSSGGGSSSD